MNGIFIPHNVSSSKNSKRWTGKFLINSDVVQRYKKSTEIYWKEYKEAFHELIEGKEKPYKVSFYFIRDSKRRFDYINAAQLPLDLMQKYEWLEDDDSRSVIPLFKGFEVGNKDTAGLYISVE